MEENTSKKPINVYNLIILDESGSMGSIYEQALSAMNETINGIRKSQAEYPQQRHFVSIVTFEGTGMHAVKTRRNRVPVGEVADMTRNDYRPGGCTPLYDAIGFSVTHLERRVKDDDAVLVTIITDGYENSSKEYSEMELKSLIKRLTRKGWTFAYIGANQDSRKVAAEMNIQNAMDFDASPVGTVKMSVKYEKSRASWCKALDSGFENLFEKTVGSFFDDMGKDN